MKKKGHHKNQSIDFSIDTTDSASELHNTTIVETGDSLEVSAVNLNEEEIEFQVKTNTHDINEKKDIRSILSSLHQDESKVSLFTNGTARTEETMRSLVQEEIKYFHSREHESIRSFVKKEIEDLRNYEDNEVQIKTVNERELESDTFTLMMMNKIFSRSWALSLFAVTAQFVFGTAIIISLLRKGTGCKYDIIACNIVSIPIYVGPEVTVTQGITIVLVVASQSDLLRSLQNIIELRGELPWDEIIGEEGDKSALLWLRRIFFPNILKFLVGILVLFASFLVIIESSEVIDLLKDFTALMVISNVDDIMFGLAIGGYLGEGIALDAMRAKSVKFFVKQKRRNYGRFCFRQVTFLLLTSGMLAYWLFFGALRQWNGSALKLQYNNCIKSKYEKLNTFGNGECDYDGIYNSEECGWDGGDCTVPTYPRCKGADPEMIGDGNCTEIYNNFDCGYDGGDCLLEMYPDCIGVNPSKIGDGVCDVIYNTLECKYDGLDCFTEKFPNCVINKDDIYQIGDGFCHDQSPHNTAYCGYDGGDCLMAEYPKCVGIDPAKISDGDCKLSFPYNTTDCGYDGGDCSVPNYPNCVGVNPSLIGNQNCDDIAPYNTRQCGFDGGDCEQP